MYNRLAAVQLITALVIVHTVFREEFMRLGALSRIAASLEEARILAYQDGRQPWKHLLAPSQLALEVLLRPAVDLDSVQPHQLIGDATTCMSDLRFQEGLTQLIMKSRYGILSPLRCWSRLMHPKKVFRHCSQDLSSKAYTGYLQRTHAAEWPVCKRFHRCSQPDLDSGDG